MFSEHFPGLKEIASQYNKTIYNHLFKTFSQNELLNAEFLQISKLNAEKATPDPNDIQKLAQIRQKMLDISQEVKFFENFRISLKQMLDCQALLTEEQDPEMLEAAKQEF